MPELPESLSFSPFSVTVRSHRSQDPYEGQISNPWLLLGQRDTNTLKINREQLSTLKRSSVPKNKFLDTTGTLTPTSMGITPT